MSKIHNMRIPVRQRAGQQLSRNSHWSLVWSNVGLGCQADVAKLRSLQTPFVRKGLKFLLKGTETADTSQVYLKHTSPDLKEGVRVTGHTSTSCHYQLDIITATFLPSATTTLYICFSVKSANSNCFQQHLQPACLSWL